MRHVVIVIICLAAACTASVKAGDAADPGEMLARAGDFAGKAETALKSADYLLREILRAHPDDAAAGLAGTRLAAIGAALAALDGGGRPAQSSAPAAATASVAGPPGILSAREVRAMIDRIQALRDEGTFESLFVADMQSKTLMACLPASSGDPLEEEARTLCLAVEAEMRTHTGAREALPVSRSALRDRYLLRGSLEKWINAPPEETDLLQAADLLKAVPEPPSESVYYDYKIELSPPPDQSAP